MSRNEAIATVYLLGALLVSFAVAVRTDFSFGMMTFGVLLIAAAIVVSIRDDR